MHQNHNYPSTYVLLVAWGVAGFMGQPTFASFVVHFFIFPFVLYAGIKLAHWEGYREGKSDAKTPGGTGN